jgi:hypothetical protein
MLPPRLTDTGWFDFSLNKLPSVLETELVATRRGTCIQHNGVHLYFTNAVAHYLTLFCNHLEDLCTVQWPSQPPDHNSLELYLYTPKTKFIEQR